jgi:hypothetical protein
MLCIRGCAPSTKKYKPSANVETRPSFAARRLGRSPGPVPLEFCSIDPRPELAPPSRSTTPGETVARNRLAWVSEVTKRARRYRASLRARSRSTTWFLVPQVRAGFAAPRCALRGPSPRHDAPPARTARWGTLRSVLLSTWGETRRGLRVSPTSPGGPRFQPPWPDRARSTLGTPSDRHRSIIISGHLPRCSFFGAAGDGFPSLAR